MNQKRTIGVIAVMLAVLVIAAPMYIFLRVPLAGALDDCRSLETLKSEKIHEAEKRYLEQEIATCNGVDIDTLEVAIGTEKASDQARKQPEATPTPSATPTSTPTEETQPRQWEYLANRAPNTKSSHNAFGPLAGMVIDKQLDDRSITVQEAEAEFRHRLTVDPMFTAATGAAFGLWSYGEVDAKTKVFAENHDEWDKANESIEKILDDPETEIKIVKLHGQYTASWAIPDSTPSVMTDLGVWRDGQLALSINGELFQIQCSFQQYWKDTPEGEPTAPKGTKVMPEPSPGMTRVEGTPVKKDKPKHFKPSGEQPSPEEPGEETSDKPSETPTPEKPKPSPTPTPTGKDPDLDPQRQGNIPEHVRDDGNLPTACEGTGVMDRNGVCNQPGSPAVDRPAPGSTYTPPADPEPEPVETQRPVEPQPTNAPSSSAPEAGGKGQSSGEVRQQAEDNSDPADNPFGETEG